MQTFLLGLAAAGIASAHTAAWNPGMYCFGGADPNNQVEDTSDAVNPLYMFTKNDWWFQHERGCDLVPPQPGVFLELPANGEFTVELAHNRGQTTFSHGGAFAGEWPDGNPHPEDWNGFDQDPECRTNPSGCEGCIQDDGAMHVQNETSATGTAFAISYQSDLSKVTMENLAVFTVLEHTPWKRIATYKVPNLPACPAEGCHCAWLWVPKGCGIPNMYMQGFKCKVTGATSNVAVAPAKPPVFCKDNPAGCTKGAKQMIAWHQLDGNNVFPPDGVSPGYNDAWGWPNGAQNDIFV